MLRLLPLVLATFATASGVITGHGAVAQGNTSDGTVPSGGLGAQAAVYAGGQPGVLSTGMVAVQWPSQVMLDGRLQLLSPDYSVLTIEPGRFALSGGQIYAAPAARRGAGDPHELWPVTGTVSASALLQTPAPVPASVLTAETNLPNASQILATVAPPQAQDDGRKTLEFKPIAGTIFDYGNATNRSTTATSSTTLVPRSMAFAPPAFAVASYQARDGAYYDPGAGTRADTVALGSWRTGSQEFDAFVPASPAASQSVPTTTRRRAPSLSNVTATLPVPVVSAPVAPSNEAAGGMLAGIQQSVAETPWFVWAGVGAAASGVAWVMLTSGD